jgi:hypothetical protein
MTQGKGNTRLNDTLYAHDEELNLGKNEEFDMIV